MSISMYNKTLESYLNGKFTELEKKLQQYIILSTKKVVNVKELATLTGLSVGYIYNLVSGRKIPHYKSDGGKLTFFKVQEIEEWLCAEKVTTIKDLENNYNPDEIEQLKQLLNTKLNELRNAEKIARSIR